jgi:ABC-type sulfate transport system permease subunit
MHKITNFINNYQIFATSMFVISNIHWALTYKYIIFYYLPAMVPHGAVTVTSSHVLSNGLTFNSL